MALMQLRSGFLRWFASLVLICSMCCFVVAQEQTARSPVTFAIEALSKPPEICPATGSVVTDLPEIQSIFYQGPVYRGQPTKTFAYVGLPTAQHFDSSMKVPGVVLVHGGGGTAFANWVKLWNDRGYAAIAMDLCGCIPEGTYGNWNRHREGGPAGWDASFQQTEEPIEDQWQTHAVSNIMLAHSLLSSMPQVDPERIGVTGISWGGYLTCIAAGVDHRFRCAVPVYGCGYLGVNSYWLATFEQLGADKATRWLGRWDPSVYLPEVSCPMLWVNGTNDFAYPMDSWQRSIGLHTDSLLSLRIRMPHGHGPAGENPAEIHVFMDSILNHGKPLATFTQVQRQGTHVSGGFSSESAVDRVELCFTKDLGKWQDRQWESIPAQCSEGTANFAADLPDGVTVWFVNLFDDRNCAVSSFYSTLEDSK